MVYADPSSANTNIVFWVAIVLFGASFSCLFLSIALRWKRERNEKKQAKLEARWRPVLYEIIAGASPSEMPTLRKKEIPDFGVIWLKMHQRLRGDSKQSLLDLLSSLGVTEQLPKLLNSRNTDHKLIALMLMTALKDERAVLIAKALFDSSYDLLSYKAAEMLMVKTPEVAIPMLLSRVTQPDWPIHKINGLLSLAPEMIQLLNFLNISLETAPIKHIPALLEITYVQSERDFGRFARIALNRFHEDPSIIKCILQFTNSHRFLPLAISGCKHPDVTVRCASLKALTKLGSENELSTIELALNDSDWQVQHNAAFAMVNNPAMNQHKAQVFLQSLPEGSARVHLLEALYHKKWLLPENWQPVEAT